MSACRKVKRGEAGGRSGVSGLVGVILFAFPLGVIVLVGVDGADAILLPGEADLRDGEEERDDEEVREGDVGGGLALCLVSLCRIS